MGDGRRALKFAAPILALFVLAGCEEPIVVAVEKRAEILDSMGYMGGVFCGPDGFVYQKQSAQPDAYDDGWVLRNLSNGSEMPLPLDLTYSLRECTTDGRFLLEAFVEGGDWGPVFVHDLSTLLSGAANIEKPLVALGGDGYWDAKFLDNKTLLFEAVPASDLSTESIGTAEVVYVDQPQLDQSGLTILTMSSADLVSRNFSPNTNVIASVGAYYLNCSAHCSQFVTPSFVWDPTTWTLHTPLVIRDPNQGVMEVTGSLDLKFDSNARQFKPLVDAARSDVILNEEMRIVVTWPDYPVLDECGPNVSIARADEVWELCLDETISHGTVASFWFDPSDPLRVQIAVYYPLIKGEARDSREPKHRVFFYDIHLIP